MAVSIVLLLRTFFLWRLKGSKYFCLLCVQCPVFIFLSLYKVFSPSCEMILHLDITWNKSSSVWCWSMFPFCSFFFFVGIMIQLFKVKEKHRELAENGKTAIKKQSAGELRLHKGFCSRSLVSNNVFFLTFTIRNIFVLVVVSSPSWVTDKFISIQVVHFGR